MNDLISRKAAIYAVTVGAMSAAMVFGRTEHGMTALKETIRAIKELPSAQPSGKDPIEREDVVEILHESMQNRSESEENLIGEIVCKVDLLPSAQPEQRWIPCSERLPERNQICIVTDETRRCAYEYGLHDETYDEENGWTYLGHRIIAWMPLPEPYKERMEE